MPKEALRYVYPDYVYTQRTRSRWKSVENQRAFFDHLAHQLNIRKPEDWHRVTARHVLQYGGASLLKNYYNNSIIKGRWTS